MEHYFNMIIPKEYQKMSFCDFLTKIGLAKSKQNILIQSGACFVNGVVCTKDTYLHFRDYVSIDCTGFEKDDYPPYNASIEVLYEDDYLLCVNKIRNCIIYPEKKEYAFTMANIVANYYKETNQLSGIHHTHRLDKDTTGCLLYAKDFITEAMMAKIFTNQEIHKKYLAIVEGRVLPSQTIETGIGRDRHVNGKMIIVDKKPLAITHYKLVKRINERYSLLEVVIETGKTHQIRLHLQSVGCPIVGDKIYNPNETKDTSLLLHCQELSFVHPVTNEKITIQAKLPEDMQQFIALHTKNK